MTTTATQPAGAPAPRERSLVPPATDRFDHVLRSEWTKFWSVRSTIWTFVSLVIVTIGISALLCLAVAANWKDIKPADRLTIDDRAGVQHVEGHRDDLALEFRRAREHVALEDVRVREHPQRLVHEGVVVVVAAVHGAGAAPGLPVLILFARHLAQFVEDRAPVSSLGRQAAHDGVPLGVRVVAHRWCPPSPLGWRITR
jgi:hypothetical protein